MDNPPQKLGADAAKASIALTYSQLETIPEVHRLIIHSNSTISGNFRVGYNGIFTNLMSVDVSYQIFEEEISRTFGIQKIRIRPFNFGIDFNYGGDYRAWDISFISVGGTVPFLTCDVSGK